MMTNSKMYEMIIGQVNEGNESIREQLKAKISERAEQTQTVAQGLAERQSRELSELSAVINEKIDNMKADIMQDISGKTISLRYESDKNAEKQINFIKSENEKLMQEVDDRIETLRNEMLDRMEDDLNKNLNSFKVISDGIMDIQKDSAVIMETLQLILTNMMLDKVNVKETVKAPAKVEAVYDDEYYESEIIREFHKL